MNAFSFLQKTIKNADVGGQVSDKTSPYKEEQKNEGIDFHKPRHSEFSEKIMKQSEKRTNIPKKFTPQV